MGHDAEYHDAMVTAIEQIWGDGFLAPGGEGNVANLVRGIDVAGKRILDIGCGIGGPACALVEKHEARVVGTDLEPALLRRSRARIRERDLGSRIDLIHVASGPFPFRDESFDVVLSSGAFTQTRDKLGIFRECRRVLKPGGWVSAYDWMKPAGDYSKDMLRWFELEGLTYEMETPERHGELLREAGFDAVGIDDRSDWYRHHAPAEYERIATTLRPRLIELVGREEADHITEDWRVLAILCTRGEMLQVYCRGRKPA